MVPQKVELTFIGTSKGLCMFSFRPTAWVEGASLCAYADRDAIGEPKDWAVTVLGILCMTYRDPHPDFSSTRDIQRPHSGKHKGIEWHHSIVLYEIPLQPRNTCQTDRGIQCV